MLKAIILLVSLTIPDAGLLVAADQSLTGKLGDSLCGATHNPVAEHGKQINDRECTLACIKKGGKYVLVDNGKVYAIENQDFKGLQQNAGQPVTITGEVNDGVIVIKKIQAAGGTSGG